MGDIIVVSIVVLIVAAIVFYLFKDHKKGVSAACKSCSLPKSAKELEKMPSWVNEYKGKS